MGHNIFYSCHNNEMISDVWLGNIWYWWMRLVMVWAWFFCKYITFPGKNYSWKLGLRAGTFIIQQLNEHSL